MRLSITIGLPLLCVSTAVGVACGQSSNSGFPPPDDDAGTTDEDSGPSPILPSEDAADGPACTTCSADLHSVVTCGSNPQLVQSCTGNTGCGPMGCIDACAAAASSKSSIGCDYYSVPPDAWTHGSCFAAFVTNTWTSPMKVSLVWKGKSIDATPFSYTPKGSGSSLTYQAVPSTGIPPNDMAIVFMNQVSSSDGYYVACPAGVKVAITSEDLAAKTTSFGHAIEIQTSVPAVVYDIYPYGGRLSYMSSATLLLPTTAWDTNFVATTMAESPATTPGVDFVAQQDGTTVTLLPTTDVTALNGVAGATKGSPVTYKINKGETVHLMQAVDTSGNDLSGSIVQSNNPIGVWGEHYCLVQNTSPPNWRIVGAVKGTKLTYDPAVSGAPATITEGQMVEFAGPEAFHVQSQDNMHPFYLAAHRPGGDCDAAHQQIPPIQALGNEYVAVANETTNYTLGGPETVNVVPPAEFLSSYVFFTDPTYGYTDLALIRVKAADGTFKPVKLDCLKTPVAGWQPVGTSGKYEYVHVDVQSAQAPVGACDNGLHNISSDGQLGITVWGYDSAVSYAYPAGASVKPINTVVVPPVPN